MKKVLVSLGLCAQIVVRGLMILALLPVFAAGWIAGNIANSVVTGFKKGWDWNI